MDPFKDIEAEALKESLEAGLISQEMFIDEMKELGFGWSEISIALSDCTED